MDIKSIEALDAIKCEPGSPSDLLKLVASFKKIISEFNKQKLSAAAKEEIAALEEMNKNIFMYYQPAIHDKMFRIVCKIRTLILSESSESLN
jgi:hypothetical protein